MDKDDIKLSDAVRKAKEYERTKSITAAVEACALLNAWAFKNLGAQNEQ